MGSRLFRCGSLKKISDQLYPIPRISNIAYILGDPIATNKPRLDHTLMGEAKILVEVELDKTSQSHKN